MSDDRLRRHHHRQRRRRRDAGRAPRPVRQADPDPGARRLAAARGRELGRRRGLRQEPLRLGRDLVRREGQGLPARASTTTSAARRSSTARRSTGCAARTSASCSHHDGISPAWPISYDDIEPYYTRAEHLYEVHGNHGEDPTEAPGQRAVPVPRGVPRAAHPAAVRRPRAGGLPPVPCPVRRPPARREHAVQPVHPVRDLRRLPVAGPGQVRRRGLRRPAGPRPPERDAAHERAGDAPAHRRRGGKP